MAKTLSQIAGEMISAVISNFSPKLIDTRSGTVVKEAFVNPAAAQFKDAYDGLDTIVLNQSIANSASMTTRALERLGANVGVTIQKGAKSTGFVRFVKFAAPTSNISIPTGTHMTTRLTNNSGTIGFTSLATVTMAPTSPGDPITGAESYVDVFVIADDVGLAGNVDAGTITTLSSPIAGIDQIFNPSVFNGGSDIQSNAALASVVSARSQGRIGTRPGYKDLILSNLQVDDVLVLGSSDADIKRNQFGGAVDIVLLGNDVIDSTETIAYTGQSVIRPLILPLVSVGSIAGFDSVSTPITLIGPTSGVGIGTDYDVVLDTTGPFAGSMKENSRIILHPVSVTPGAGTFLTITYSNNELVRTVQSFLADENSNVLGSDVLAKAGIKINALVTGQIKVIPGYDVAATVISAQDSTMAYFNSLLLGKDAEISQIQAAISNTPGVSFVDLPSFVLAKETAPLVPVLEILANNQEFIRAASVTLTAL